MAVSVKEIQFCPTAVSRASRCYAVNMKWFWIATSVIISSAIVSSAQEKPLGDVARETRAAKSDSHAKKVVTNDDLAAHSDPIGANEGPVEAVNKARVALLADHTHSCLREATGNSGPGWSESRLTRIAADRAQITANGANQPGGEYITIGGDVYRRVFGRPWEKLQAAEAKLVAEHRFDLPDVLEFAFSQGGLKFVGQENIEGVLTFHYGFKAHVVDMDRTIDIWLRANDHLPLKTHMVTTTTSALTAPITWEESASCTYGQIFRIERPM